MPLKFFYPKWVNGERVSGTLNGDGYYKLLRYVLYLNFKLDTHTHVGITAFLLSGVRIMDHWRANIGNK